MQFIPERLRGPACMVAATGTYVINDTLMKLATEGLPPFQVLFLRGLMAAIWCVPILAMLGYFKHLKQVAQPFVLLRNGCEMLAVLCFIVALANMPIADATALGQVAPLLLLLGSAVFFRERVGALQMGLVGLGFVGALMVAQPGAAGISVYALLALANAVLCALRDLTGRKVPAAVPSLIVAFSAVLVVMVGAGIAHVSLEQWVMPEPGHLLLLLGAGLFLVIGHFFIFLAYRIGPMAAVAPFYYAFSVWAVLSGLFVFGQFPNLLAFAGIALIVSSGLAVVSLDRRRRRQTIAA